jgi:hypothetical protein
LVDKEASAIFASVSEAVDAGEVPAVMLDCGRGDMVVARDEGSTVVLSSTMMVSSAPELEDPPRPGGSSTAIEAGEPSRSSMSVSLVRFSLSAAPASHSDLDGF